MKAPKKTLLATSLLALPALASALGLGGITVRSGLNQPLDAEISVSVNSPAERDTLSVQLANAEDWSRVGIDASRTPSDLKFAIEKNSRGEPVIRVTSQQIIREPYLQMLIEVNWAKGRLLREYSLLLDPPVMASALGSKATSSPAKETISAPAMAETMPASKPVVDVKPATKPMVEAKPVSQMMDKPAVAPAAKAAADSYGPTKGGDTLWLIANANRPSANTNLDRMMVAILRMNPDAFQNGNINSLKKGQILRLPSASETDKISLAEAKRVIGEQNTLWRGYQTRSAENAIQVADPGASAALRPSAVQAESQPRLELVPPKTSAADTQALSTAKADLARLQEEVNSKQAEAKDLKARVGQLESLQSDQKRMIELKDSEIASLNKALTEMRLKADAAAVSTPVAAVVETPVQPPIESPTPPVSTENLDPIAATTEAGTDTKTDIWGAEPSASDPAAAATEAADPALAMAADPATGMPDTAPPVDGTSVTPVADDAVVVSEPIVEPAAEPVAVAPMADATVEEQPWYMNPFVLGGAGLGIAGLLGFALTRKKAPAPIKSNGMSLSDNFGIPAVNVEPVVGGFADTLGDEDEARIRAAINANPQDLWSHLDLLRLYFSRRDAEKFESAASSMYGFVVDTEAAQWSEARAMGEQLVPHSALFQTLPDFGSMDNTNDMAFDTASFEPTVVQEPIPPPSYQAQLDEPLPVDEPLGALDLAYFDEPAPTPSMASKPVVPEEDAAFNFDLDLDAPVPANLAPEVATPVVEAKDEFNFDFNFDAPSKMDVAPQLPPSTVMGNINIDDVTPVSFDSGMLDMNADDLMIGEDAVGTKLDLARAYLDMGDPDGARSMLEEVLSEGSDLQRNEAKDLLGRMA